MTCKAFMTADDREELKRGISEIARSVSSYRLIRSSSGAWYAVVTMKGAEE